MKFPRDINLEMHDLARLLLCQIGRIQPSCPPLPSFTIGKELPMA
jgi:hypothetical protein